MKVIDDHGRLFGIINIVDALVVLLILAVMIAGLVLVVEFGGDGELPKETDTIHATLDLGTQPAFIVEEVNEGDNYSPSSNSNLTITDVHLTPQGGGAKVIVRVRLEGPAREDGIEYDGAAPRLGRTVDILTNTYNVSGRIRAVGSDDALDRAQPTVVLRDTVAPADAEELAVGDEIQIAGRTVATIEGLSIFPTQNPDQHRVYLQTRISAHRQQGNLRFGGQPVRRGQTLTLPGEGYTIDGRIERVGTLDQAVSAVVLRDTIAAPEARELATGDEIRVAGRTVATIEDRAIYATQNPDQHVVYLETRLNVRRQQGELRFGSQPVQRGQTLTLPGEEYTINGNVERVGGGLERDSADILIQDTIDIETADRLAKGDAAVVAGMTTATVENVELYGTNNPERKRAFVGLSLETVGHGERPRFGDTPVQVGRSITFRNAEYTLSGDIERVEHLQQRGTETTKTVTIRMEEVRQEFASAIEEGMVEQVDGEPIAEITAVDVEPSTVIVTGDRGELQIYDHPYNRDVTITAELQVRETSVGTNFKGQPIRQQDTITLDLNSITVRGTVVRIR